MATIIPAINVPGFETFGKQVSIAKTFLPLDAWLHIDVVDGKFSPAVTWGDPKDIPRIKDQVSGINFEIHLMVVNPELSVKSWLQAGARRLIVHAEALSDEEIITDQCREHKAEAMLAINPETPVQKLIEYKSEFDFFQILAVTPGWAGQKFNPEVLEKIKTLRANIPHAKIEVDGGINPETAKLCVKAGANILVSASYILGNPNPKQAYEELVRAISNLN